MSIKIENTEVIGWEHAIRGMRNPKNSWDRSDTELCPILIGYTPYGDGCYKGYLGENDLALMNKLAAGGPVHAKYRRMIVVYVDITAPLYWWKEFDTYKVGTVANSCSTMHKIHDKQFTAEDFSYDHLMNDNMKDCPLLQDPNDYENAFDPTNVFVLTINMLNACRKKYLDVDAKLHRTDLDLSQEKIIELTKIKKELWWQMIQLLPSSYNQKRTIMLNYEVLAGIYPMRKNHKLDEWHVFCEWIESLPYSELITGKVHVEFEEVPGEVSKEIPETAGNDIVERDLSDCVGCKQYPRTDVCLDCQRSYIQDHIKRLYKDLYEVSNEVPETAGDDKCKKCNGTGFVQVAPSARGIKKCPYCNGTGKVSQR